MNLSGLFSGIFIILLGIVLISMPLFVSDKTSFVSWIYGIPLLIIGIVILFNIKKEDEIEEIRYSKK